MSAPATKSYISDWAFTNQTFLHKYLKKHVSNTVVCLQVDKKVKKVYNSKPKNTMNYKPYILIMILNIKFL